MTNSEQMRAAAGFWDREVHQPGHMSWMEHPEVRHYVNSHFDGWPLDWLVRTFPETRFRRALSIGCGTGPLERDLVRRGVCERVDAFDGSLASIVVAREIAGREGMDDRLRYFVADFDNLRLRNVRYDAIFFHQSAHHVAYLEKLFHRLLGLLEPGGMLYLDEYIGPSRTDWNEQSIAGARAVYDRIPRAARLFDVLPLPIQSDDPSEAKRSAEIVDQLRVGYDIEVSRGYGGNILAVMYPTIDWGAVSASVLDDLIASDREHAAAEGPYHAVMVARPKRGWRRLMARLRYFAEPKWRRVRWEFWNRLGYETRY